MFLPNSRYHKVATIETVDGNGQPVIALKLRRLTSVAGEAHRIEAGDRLDLYAQTVVGDATQFWHIADANTALDGRALTETPGETLLLPRP